MLHKEPSWEPGRRNMPPICTLGYPPGMYASLCIPLGRCTGYVHAVYTLRTGLVQADGLLGIATLHRGLSRKGVSC